jgi:hypothetical protein
LALRVIHSLMPEKTIKRQPDHQIDACYAHASGLSAELNMIDRRRRF